mmetsp:Transcript_16814/g.28526  ORF Transcript_16814/g.28526 Transcript_16814/m.28526 type:complete len:85 (+) Transcript_16814:150-404(+)
MLSRLCSRQFACYNDLLIVFVTLPVVTGSSSSSSSMHFYFCCEIGIECVPILKQVQTIACSQQCYVHKQTAVLCFNCYPMKPTG